MKGVKILLYDEKELNIWGTLTITNKENNDKLIIKSDVADEYDCTVVIEDLIGQLYYKDIDFNNCESEMVIYIEIKTAGIPIMEINKTYLKILEKINGKISFEISYTEVE